MTIRYIRSTFITDQSKFIANCQYGKQIGKILDITKTGKNVTGPQNTFYWVWNLKNLETRFHILQMLKNILNLLTIILCMMGQTLFRTSSWGSGFKQNRFGIKFKNTVQMQSSFESGSGLLFRKYLKFVLFENGPS